MTSESLVLGPLLRFVDETTASVWVETRHAGTVRVRVANGSWTAPTFCVHSHHFALVELDSLEPGRIYPYTVEIDDRVVWPSAETEFPPSKIATLKPGDKLRMAFGSCRKSTSHDAEGNDRYGVDAMRAYAFHMMENDEKWPDLVLFLGDQVYADETSPEMRDYIASRRDPDEPPGLELKDFEEYSHLYYLAWHDPANRWLLSTLPSAMIFDDHDIRDDWNSSHTWRQQMEATSWWHDRIVAGLSSYWIYQHLGNLSPANRARDELWQQVLAAQERGDDSDLGPLFDAFADRVNDKPDTYRWAHARDVGSSRLVVVDSRAARVLDPKRRAMVDEEEMSWLDDQLQGDFDHVFIGTSLPFLLSPGLHGAEAWDEAVAQGAWGKRASGMGERIRQGVDLEHWAAFQDSFRKIAGMVTEIADGKRGKPPATVTFLSGDVHNSYVAEVDRANHGCRILQAVCSPIRNPLPRAVRMATRLTASRAGTKLGQSMARSAKVQPPPFTWQIQEGLWFENNLATLEAHGRELSMRWERGELDGPSEHPTLEIVRQMRFETS